MLTQDWNIQSRAVNCAVSSKPFQKGERVYSALFWREGQYQRVDLCEEAWLARNENIAPVSAWQNDFVPTPPPPPEALKKDDAESLLRRLQAENQSSTRNARYILGLMLERKKILRQVDRQKQNGTAFLVYEQVATGEVWLIEDPGLRLGELQAVQEEVVALLTANDAPVLTEAAPTETPAETEPTEVAAAEEAAADNPNP